MMHQRNAALNHARIHALLLAAATLAGCGRGGSEDPTPRASLVATWDLATVNGAALPTPSPEEPTVTLESVSMTLEADGSYTLASSFRLPGQASAQSTTLAGTWVADDDALTFENQGQGPAIVMFGYRMDGELLRMVDEQQNEWAMRRR